MASSPAPAGPTVRLLAAPLTHWPEALLGRLGQIATIEIVNLENSDLGVPEGESSTTLLLGYGDPARGLAAALAGEPDLDVPLLLESWRRTGERLLALRRQQPERVMLMDPTRLDGKAEAALRLHLAPGSAGSEGSDEPSKLEHPDPGPPLPAVVAHYLSQRSDLKELLADLEANADLLGRELAMPEAVVAPRGLVLAEALLGEWRTSWTAHRRALQSLQDLQQQLVEAQARLREHQEQARQQAEESDARLRDAEEERELILLQLQQVQEELTHTFAERTRLQELGESAGQRLASLELECRHLFLHSRLDPEIDRGRIPLILRLMRESLQV
jgi:hypothetical protein